MIVVVVVVSLLLCCQVAATLSPTLLIEDNTTVTHVIDYIQLIHFFFKLLYVNVVCDDCVSIS